MREKPGDGRESTTGSNSQKPVNVPSAFRISQPYAFRFCHPKVGRDREDNSGFPQLVEKWRLCLLPASGRPALGDASTHPRPEDRASGGLEKLPADGLLERLARYGSRRFTSSASRHWHS